MEKYKKKNEAQQSAKRQVRLCAPPAFALPVPANQEKRKKENFSIHKANSVYDFVMLI